MQIQQTERVFCYSGGALLLRSKTPRLELGQTVEQVQQGRSLDQKNAAMLGRRLPGGGARCDPEWNLYTMSQQLVVFSLIVSTVFVLH